MNIDKPRLINKTPLLYSKKIQNNFLPKTYKNPGIKVKSNPLLYIGISALLLASGAYIEKKTRVTRMYKQLQFFMEHPKILKWMTGVDITPIKPDDIINEPLPANTISLHKAIKGEL